MAESAKTTLYDRLGGVYSIATVVDDFIDRIMVDARLNANPRVNEAHHRVAPPGFKYLDDRDGLLGHGRPAKIYRQIHVGVSCAVANHPNGVGRLHG
jgi:hypothetical protein